MAGRRARHEGLSLEQHIHVHDDELDEFEREMTKMDAKLDRLIWALMSATIASATAVFLLALQLTAGR